MVESKKAQTGGVMEGEGDEVGEGDISISLLSREPAAGFDTRTPGS